MSTLTEAIEAMTERQRQINARLDQIELKAARQGLVKPGIPFSGDRELKSDTKAFLNYVRKGERGLNPGELKALVEDTTGQYLVSADVEQELFRALAEESTIRPLASVKSTKKDRINVRTITETAVGWGKLETGSLITESTLVPTESTVYVEDLYGLTKVGEDELDDSDYNLIQTISDSFARAIGAAENAAFIAGLGHSSKQPDGIILDTTLLSQCTTTTAAGAVTMEDLLSLVYSVPAQYRKNGAFVMHTSTELALRKLRASGDGTHLTNQFLWQPSLAEGRPNTLLGYPCYCDDNLDEISDTEGILVIFGDFKRGYRIYDRQGITVQRLNELYSEAGCVGFRVHARVGGFVIKPANKALALLKEHS